LNDGGTVPLATYRFAFTGRSGEYFRIWIVSLSLSVLTLGIYSAWGKVRKKRYLYSHTELRQYLGSHPATEELIQRAEQQR
jgi:uncharacterized membrane protein YjgN (DUF898 family)